LDKLSFNIFSGFNIAADAKVFSFSIGNDKSSFSVTTTIYRQLLPAKAVPFHQGQKEGCREQRVLDDENTNKYWHEIRKYCPLFIEACVD
jgi:hypothetical protein